MSERDGKICVLIFWTESKVNFGNSREGVKPIQNLKISSVYKNLLYFQFS